MTTANIYHYSSARAFLLDVLSARQKENPKFSVRSWAKEMGFGTHTLLVMLLQGKRPLRLRHVAFFAKGMPLTSSERLYLQALIQHDSAPTMEEKELCRLWLADLNPGKSFYSIDVDHFLAISHWVHMALLSMTELKGSGLTEEKAIQRLGSLSNAAEVRAAIERLTNLGLLKKDEQGKMKASADHVSTKDDVANEGAREYHKKVSALAGEMIDKLPLDQREYQGCAVAIPRTKRQLAKKMIRKFRSQFIHAMGPEAGDDVYQLNLQLFQLTESPFEDEGAETEATPHASQPKRERTPDVNA